MNQWNKWFGYSIKQTDRIGNLMLRIVGLKMVLVWCRCVSLETDFITEIKIKALFLLQAKLAFGVRRD